MDKVILKSKFIKLLFDTQSRIYTSVYLPETINMTNKEWKDQMLEIKQVIEEYKPLYIIDDNRERLYSYSPDMQIWTLELFVPSWNNIGLKKYAQIIPEEIVGKLTSQQIGEFASNDFEMKYDVGFFEDYISALDWIKQ